MKNTLILFFLLLSAGMAWADDTVMACGETSFPPFNWKEGEKIIGAAPETARLIFKDLGLDFDCRDRGPWKRCQLYVKTGEVDMFVAGYMNDERKQYAVFPKVYLYEDPAAVFVMKGNEFTFEKWEDLSGKKIGRLLGGTLGKDFDTFIEQNLRVEYVVSWIQNFKKLELGRIDFFAIGLYPGIIVTYHGASPVAFERKPQGYQTTNRR
jgi:polar amino acid transport system substrate-binding protein